MSRTVSHCDDKPLGVVDEYVFTSSEQLNEDITAADVLLQCRRDTLKTLQLHYAPMHKSEVLRLEGEARQARISLDNAHRALTNEQAYHSMLVDSDSGRRPRCEHELELLKSLDDKIAGLCRVAKRRRVAVAGERKLLDVHLEIVRNELRSQRVVEIRQGIMEGRARLVKLESVVTCLKARHDELAAQVAVVVAPVVLLSEASSYVSASDAQLASLQRVRAAFLKTIAEKRAEALTRKQRREQHSFTNRLSAVGEVDVVCPSVGVATVDEGLFEGMACGNEETFGDGFDDTFDDQTSLPMCASSASEETFGDGFDDIFGDQTSLPMCASSASVVESAVGGGCCQGSETSVHVIGEAVIDGRNVETSPGIEHVPAEVASVHEAGARIVPVKKECTVLPSVAAGAVVVDACVVISDD